MNMPERAEVQLGIPNINALTSSYRYRKFDSPPPFPEGELEGAQRAFAETFGGTPRLTQIDPNKFFIATAKDGAVKREYYRPTSDEGESFKFVPQASCDIGLIKGSFGINIEWRQDANFRRDSLTIFPFDDEMKLRLKPGEELAVDWTQGQVSKIELLTHQEVDGKPQKYKAFSTWNLHEEARQENRVNFWQDNWTRRFQRVVDLEYLRADSQTRRGMDAFMESMARKDPDLEHRAYVPIDLLHLERDRDEGAIIVEQVDADDEEGNVENGIVVKRFESSSQESILDDVFIPEPFDPLALLATIFQRKMLTNPENAPSEVDEEWLNQHSVVRELIKLRWTRRSPDPRKIGFRES